MNWGGSVKTYEKPPRARGSKTAQTPGMKSVWQIPESRRSTRRPHRRIRRDRAGWRVVGTWRKRQKCATSPTRAVEAVTFLLVDSSLLSQQVPPTSIYPADYTGVTLSHARVSRRNRSCPLTTAPEEEIWNALRPRCDGLDCDRVLRSFCTPGAGARRGPESRPQCDRLPPVLWNSPW